MSLSEQVKLVAEARNNYQTISELLKVKKLEFETTHADLIKTVKESADIVSVAETQLREATIKAYNETGNKQPVAGVGIRETTSIDYNKDEALKWAKSHDMALSLDTKAFEKIVKVSPPEFVKVTTVPQATISTDLSFALENNSEIPF
jgi:hypothetical protein